MEEEAMEAMEAMEEEAMEEEAMEEEAMEVMEAMEAMEGVAAMEEEAVEKEPSRDRFEVEAAEPEDRFSLNATISAPTVPPTLDSRPVFPRPPLVR